MTMALLAAVVSGAAEVPAAALTYEERWDVVDIRASRTGRTGAYLLAAGFAQAALGAMLVTYGDQRDSEELDNIGTLFLTTGSISGAVGIPLTLGGSMRAARSIHERGVHAPTTAGVTGWTCFGLSFFGIPAPVTLPLSIVFGVVQLDVNRRVRERSGLPPVRPDIRWWEAAPVGATITIVPGAALAGR